MCEEEPWTLPLPSSEQTPPFCVSRWKGGKALICRVKKVIYFELEGFLQFPLLFYTLLYNSIYIFLSLLSCFYCISEKETKFLF